MTTYNVLVKTGYVEDSDNGWLWLNYFSKKKNLKPEEIWERLKETLHLYVKNKFEKGITTHSNCGKIPKNANFCPHCGKSTLSLTAGELETEIQHASSELIRELARQDCIKVEYEVQETFENNGWNIWGSPVNGRMVFIAGADRALANPNSPCLEISSKKVTFR